MNGEPISSVQFSSVLFHAYSVIQYKIKDNFLTSYMYKITKKMIQFSKYYLVISYDQRYSKSYFNMIRRSSYVGIKLIWKEPSSDHVRQKSAGFVQKLNVTEIERS